MLLYSCSIVISNVGFKYVKVWSGFFFEFKATIDVPYMCNEHHSVSNIQVKLHHIITLTEDIIFR